MFSFAPHVGSVESSAPAPAVSARSEDFLNILLPVQGYDTVENSLRSYLGEEVFDGDNMCGEMGCLRLMENSDR